MSEQMSENKMGVMPVKKLILSMSLPMMVSMLVQAFYNVADSLFVARVSEDALTAVTLAFPMQNLMIAVATGTGVGINAVLSKALGARNYDDANRSANTGILLTVIHYVLFLFVGLFFTVPFVLTLTNDGSITGFAVSYIGIVTMSSFGCFFQLTFERLLQSTGRTVLSMVSQMTGAVINLILDPIMIFGLFGMPRLETAGAAIATVIGQCCAALLALLLNIKYNKEIKLSVKEIIRPAKDIVKKIYFVGIPSILMVSIGSLMTYLMNILLATFSSTAQAVFGVYFRLQSFFFMPVFGLNNGLIPVLAYNYGSRNQERIREALRFAIFLAASIMCVGTIVMELIPVELLMMFEASDHMLEIGIPALRIIALHFPIAAICIALGSVFQAFSRSYYSLIVSLGRQLVILIPVAWLMSLTGVLTNVWWAFPIAEVASLVLTLIFYARVKRTVVLKL